MKIVNSLSGGKSSSYIAKEFNSDYNVFALVRTNDKDCQYPDKLLRQRVSDKIGQEFVGTLEMDDIIKIMFDLEQYIGKEIIWVTGDTFDEIIKKHNNYLPSLFARYCTTYLKMIPIFEWWQSNINEICYMNIGFRYGEENRMNRLNDKLNNGVDEFKTIIGKRGNKNKWGMIPWRILKFPLIDNKITKYIVESYWKDKPVAFTKSYHNNCVGCFHRNPIMLAMLKEENQNKMNWFEKMELKTGNRFIANISYNRINNWVVNKQLSLDFFNECDSGYCSV